MDTPEPMTQPDDATFADLNAGEVEWVKINLDWLAEAGWDGSTTDLGLRYDHMYSAWAAAGELDRPEPNDLVNAFGIGLGDVLNRELGARWQVYGDARGASLVCHLATAGVTLFPVESVARKWEAGERSWVEGFVAAVAGRVREIAASDPR